MRSLIPTPVVDKNGKLTTVHKKPSAAPSASKLAGVAPTLGASKSDAQVTKEYKPTQAQLKTQGHGFPVFSKQIENGLITHLTHGAFTSVVNLRASDVDIYAALANIKDTTNALACMFVKEGVPDHEFLQTIGLPQLENTDDSRRAMIQEALERRIPASSFIAFENRNKAYKNDPYFMDAAQTSSIASFEKVKNLVDEVRRGTVSFNDLMVVGPKAINNLRRFNHDVVSMMQKLNDGSANYTAEQMRDIFMKCTQAHELDVMVQLTNKYGGEYATSIKDPSLAHDITLACDFDGRDYKDAVTYADEFRQRTFRNHKQVYELFKAGVDLDFAVEQSRKVDENSVQRIIALHSGIAKPVSEGWL